jgi:hypothetical protein
VVPVASDGPSISARIQSPEISPIWQGKTVENAKLDTFPNRPKLDTEPTKEKSHKPLWFMAFGVEDNGLEPMTSCMP